MNFKKHEEYVFMVFGLYRFKISCSEYPSGSFALGFWFTDVVVFVGAEDCFKWV